MDKVFVGARVGDLDTSSPPIQISRVTLRVDGETTYTAGDDTGRTLEKSCPWGTQAMCDGILAGVRGIGYQPFSGTDGLMDPAAEVGDGITIGDVYSVLAKTDITFDRLYTADPSAPGGDEVEDEYPYKSRSSRLASIQQGQIYSKITKTAEQIRLEVANEVAGLNARITLEVNKITSEVNDTAAGLNSKIEQTASSLTTQINDTQKGLNSKIEQTAASLTAKITATDGRVTSLSQTVDSIALRVQNAEGDIGQLELTSAGLTTRVSTTEGNVSTLQQTASSLQSQITSTNGAVSSLQQTATSLSSSITDVDGRVSTVEQTIDGLTVTDPWNGTTYIDGASVDTKNLYAEGVYGQTIYLFKSKPPRGTQNLDPYIAAEFRTWESSSSAGNLKLDIWSRAISLNAYGGDIYIDSRLGYVTLEAYSGVTCGNDFYPKSTNSYSCGTSMFRWTDIYATNGTIQTSDREKKKDIHYGLEKYEALFDLLRPVSYKLVDGQSGRTHLGFISQDVEEALETCGISSQDFAGFIKTPREEGAEGYDYSLRYGEFIALCIHKIQKLEARIAELERRVLL